MRGNVVVPLRTGRFGAAMVPQGFVVELLEVYGIGIPPVGIPDPACCRSVWIRFNPARRLSAMSAFCVTT